MTQQKPGKSGNNGPVIVLVVILISIIAIIFWYQAQSRLSVGRAFGGAGFVDAPKRTKYPVFHVEPQIIYRLDNNRYVEIRNYESCQPTRADEWVSEAWYYDLARNIKTEVSTAMLSYQGRIINADPSGKNLVFPIAGNNLICSDRGCGGSSALYSTDYGKTFKFYHFTSNHSPDPFEDSKNIRL